jgi:phage portal protein BeeE
MFTYGGQMVEFSSFDRGKLLDCYRNTDSVFGLINRIAKRVGELGKYIELVEAKTEKGIEKHWILDVLRQPNDRYTLQNFLIGVITQKLIYGDNFVYCEPYIGSKRGIKAMYFAPGNKVLIEKGGWREPLKGIKLEGSDVLMNMDEVFQSFYFNPDLESFYGFSPLTAAAASVQIIRNAKKRQNTSVTNGGVNTLVTPKPDAMGLMPQDQAALEAELNSESNINKTKYLRNAIEVHKLGGTPVELGLLDSSKDSITALCFAYEFPIDLYYGQSKYENAREARKAEYESIAIPLLEDFLNDFMLYCNRQYKDTLGLKFIVNRDKIDVLKNSPTEILTNLGLMGASLNEKREAYGYEPINEPYANEPMLPLGIQFGGNTYDINENDPIDNA